jgi:hypothetical protein
MSTDSPSTEPAGVRVPNSTLPPVPLTDEQLAPLAARDDVDAVHIPDGRPESVYTLSGSHDGDILEFWVEFPDRYVAFRYGPTGTGLAWLRHDSVWKDEPIAECQEDVLDEDYRHLEVPV